jgi:hypothetical protein
MLSPFALEWNGYYTIAAVMVIVFFGLFLVPALVTINRDGKRELGPLRRLTRFGMRLGPVTPAGAGDNNPGRVGDPAPGMPDGQPDPWGARAQRGAPPIQS